MKTQMRILTVALFILFAGCSKVPITGRKQVNLLPETQLTAMALQQYSQVLDDSKVISNTADAQLVQKVGKNITDGVSRLMQQLGMSDRIAGYKWEYHLIQSTEVNAWCLPGGKIAVYSGIMPITQNEAGLATVMGHEVAHAVARHGNERMSQALLAQMGGIALDVALSNKPEQTRSLFDQAYGVGVTAGALLPFSRLQESEADKLGLVFMAMAGYNPNDAITFWERMVKQSQSANIPVFLSDHPSDAQRIADLKAFMPEAMKYYHPK